jgi:hypothetical protein
LRRLEKILRRLDGSHLDRSHDLVASIAGGALGLAGAVVILACLLVVCPPILEAILH